MTWENGRELKSFTKNGTTTTFKYDINGMRVRKDTGNVSTEYYYDDNNVLYGLRYQSDYFYFYYDENGEISSMLVNNAVPYVFEKNAQGDVIGIINEDGQRVVKYIYDAWGAPLKTLDAAGNDVTNGAWAVAVPFRYRGYIYDTETGLYYLQSRFYDPQTGRFINADAYTNTETGTPYSANMFAYCENNPVAYVDPTGYWPCGDHVAITEQEGFSGNDYKLVRYWCEFADNDEYCSSNSKYSAPFHSRGNGLDIGKNLYNLALKVKTDKNASKKKFSFTETNKDKYYNISFLTYDAKNGNVEAATDAQNKLKDELDKASVDKRISMLLGLALHTVQDYFAHVIPVRASYKVVGVQKYKNTRRKFNNRFQYLKYLPENRKRTFTDEEKNKYKKLSITMTQINDLIGMSNEDLEDNTSIFPWRIKLARNITKKVFNYWTYKNGKDEGKKITAIRIYHTGLESIESVSWTSYYVVKPKKGITNWETRTWKIKTYRYYLTFY